MKSKMSKVILLGLITFSVIPASAHHSQDFDLLIAAGAGCALGAVTGFISGAVSYTKYLKNRKAQENTDMWQIKQQNQLQDLQKCKNGMELVSRIRADLNNYIEQKSTDDSFQLSEPMSNKYANELSGNQKLKLIVYMIDQVIREDKPIDTLFTFLNTNCGTENSLQIVYNEYKAKFHSIVEQRNYDLNPSIKYDDTIVGALSGVMLGAFWYSVVYNY